MASSRSDGSSSSSRRPAPVPYRVGPMEYQPPVFCRCKAKAARWISWSVDNPGRRYFKCRNAQDGGCDFFDWCDKLTSSFLRELLNDLRDAVMSLRMEKDQLRQEVEECRERLVEDTNRIEETRAELAAVRQNCFEIWKELCCSSADTQIEALPEVTLTDALVELCE
ncbi:hypothetical protein OsJ_23019 [Oryza sativa Japonica Group]|uniref:GRF-type domain-containing protein n=1 Tax=Oryza sativa subsp. japonica TaxID=39947 RepID=B9FVE5_ORYSJ|nr:hypothetical protein OsJ_23019 [Oryza sativa Japonica Group]